MPSVCVWMIDTVCALTVIPRSRSTLSLSRNWALASGGSVCVIWSRRSASVLFPWSMCAMMLRFLMRSGGKSSMSILRDLPSLPARAGGVEEKHRTSGRRVGTTERGREAVRAVRASKRLAGGGRARSDIRCAWSARVAARSCLIVDRVMAMALRNGGDPTFTCGKRTWPSVRCPISHLELPPNC